MSFKYTLMFNMRVFSSKLEEKVKGLVHPKNLISLCFTHPRSIGEYDFLLSDESNRSYIQIVLAIPSVIIAVGG